MLRVALLLCGCLSGMTRAPTTMPPDGRVDCTDSAELPVAALVGLLVAGAAVAYGASVQPSR